VATLYEEHYLAAMPDEVHIVCGPGGAEVVER
jgi:hypothetical protein